MSMARATNDPTVLPVRCVTTPPFKAAMEKTRQEVKGQEMDKTAQSSEVALGKPSRVDGKIIRKIVSSGIEGQDSQEK